MGAIFGGLFGFLGSAVSGFFGLKQAQGQAIEGALKTIGDVETSQGTREAAIASIISAEASSGYWMAACWRPLTMLTFLGFLVSYWFGYVPAGLQSDHMPPMIGRLFDIMELGIGGYMGGRSVEKIFTSLSLGSVLKAYISKKLA